MPKIDLWAACPVVLTSAFTQPLEIRSTGTNVALRRVTLDRAAHFIEHGLTLSEAEADWLWRELRDRVNDLRVERDALAHPSDEQRIVAETTKARR